MDGAIALAPSFLIAAARRRSMPASRARPVRCLFFCPSANHEWIRGVLLFLKRLVLSPLISIIPGWFWLIADNQSGINPNSEIWNRPRRRARPRCLGFRDRKETDVVQLICSVSLIAKRSRFSRTRTTPQIRNLGLKDAWY